MTARRLLISTIVLGLVAITGSWEAEARKVGVAAAVNPMAFGTPPGAGRRMISIGRNVVYNERIDTSTGGLVQILLVDGSTFTVGPNSDLVIDRFVYNPDTSSGELVATFSKGVMRFVGGKLSKKAGQVRVKTPIGALAIRGGMFDLSVGDFNFASFLFGNDLIYIAPDGTSYRVFQLGYGVDLNNVPSGGTPVIIKVPPSIVQFFQDLLNGRPGANGGASNVPTNTLVIESGLPQIGSNLPTYIYAPLGSIITIPKEDIEQWLIDLNNATGDRARNDIIEQLNKLPPPPPPPMKPYDPKPPYPYYPDDKLDRVLQPNPDLPGNH